MARELGSRSPRSYAALRAPNELVVVHRFARSSDPRAKSNASFVAADGAISVGSEAMTNLARDARCLAKNWHPNIARIRHVDIAGDELTVATELVDGVTLVDLFRAASAERTRRPASDEPVLPLAIIVRILVDVVTGLSGLHGLRDDTGAALGTIHGALSPANIVVGKDGVARLLNALRPRPLHVAAGTEAVGYAAPEALDPGANQDARADLHSVGVILWEALEGRRLYEETDPARVLARQREEDVPRPSIPAGSPFAALAGITMQAMAFDASLRFKTAAELGAALRKIAGIATGSVVAARVAELAGDRIRARRLELDPSATGKRRLSDRGLPAAGAGGAAGAGAAGRGTAAAAAAAVAASRDAGARANAGANANANANESDGAIRVERETLPPMSVDPSDLAPASTPAVDLSVRDFLAAGEAPSTPGLPAAPGSSPAIARARVEAAVAPPPKPAAKPAPPLVRKTAAAMAATNATNANANANASANANANATKGSPVVAKKAAPAAAAPTKVSAVAVREPIAQAAVAQPVVERPPARAPAPPPIVAQPIVPVVRDAPVRDEATPNRLPPPAVTFDAGAVDALAVPVPPAPASDRSPVVLQVPAAPDARPAAPFLAAPSFAPPAVAPREPASSPQIAGQVTGQITSASTPPYERDSERALAARAGNGAAMLATPDSTPDAFTPAGVSVPRDRRTVIGILVGSALAVLLLVGFFTVRAFVGDSGTKTGATATVPSGDTTGSGRASANASANANANANAAENANANAGAAGTAAGADNAADKPSESATAPTPTTEPVAPATATAPEPAATAESTPAAAANAAPARAPDIAPTTTAAVNTGSGVTPAAAPPPAAAKPPGPSKPKRPTYEPLGI
jgi:serine/threonine-protein kinase